MRQFTLLILFTFLILTSSGQDKKDLAVSFSAGIFNSPYFYKAYPRGFYALAFDYHVSKRSIISANYLAGKHEYYDNILSNAPDSYVVYPQGTNATAEYNIFSVSYKYKIVNTPKFSIVPGIGAGILTLTENYPYTRGTSTDFNTSSWSDLAFPVTLDINYKLSKHWQLGLTSGFLIEPDFPILALHVGPKLSYVLK